ncbi:CDP-alcohol phosphatidyltransferase family protein [Flavobacterium silvaticum]|uniref:CDP-alcohol phosphatidyltransferase family protein n=1 Tax=Flavobacterium silvaticum TaxID=1852020 RepID=A0A972JF40_9FLAO|nr:CDP-alcohol phosphatidyltransferase family protein [Flavobacterium silvaticum]NMH27554.1 CDP-alcohol phosphatidyltransferase family protein [Flavobacterium silvaticum]
MTNKDNIFTIPNALSFYRLLMVPVIIWTLVSHNRSLFITLICINLITDILDGFIARTFNMSTEIGARLDSLADIGTFLLSISGFWIFERDFVIENRIAFLLVFGFYLVPQFISLVRFHRPTSFHLYTSKALGYIQGIFIFTFFVFGYWNVYFYFMVVASCLADFEVLLVVLSVSKLRSNAKTIFHVLKTKDHDAL